MEFDDEYYYTEEQNIININIRENIDKIFVKKEITKELIELIDQGVIIIDNEYRRSMGFLFDVLVLTPAFKKEYSKEFSERFHKHVLWVYDAIETEAKIIFDNKIQLLQYLNDEEYIKQEIKKMILDLINNIDNHYYNIINDPLYAVKQLPFRQVLAFNRTSLMFESEILNIFGGLKELKFNLDLINLLNIELKDLEINSNTQKNDLTIDNFYWIKNDNNSHLEKLFDGLKQFNYIKQNTDYKDFVKIFSGEANQINKRIIWIASKPDIILLFELLINKGFIERPKSIYDNIALCFWNKNENKPFKNLKQANQDRMERKPTNKNTVELNKIITSL